MAKAGRPQGGPKGQTDQANALAVFVRELTKEFTVRELAERYKISKTSWGEYRAGIKTIHLHLLKRLVDDAVRDERTRTVRWEQAQRLHAQATAALQPPPLAQPAHLGGEVTPLQAAAQASATLEDAERLVHILLGVIAGLQMQAPLTASTDAAAAGPAVPDPAVATGYLREAHDRLDLIRVIHTTVSGVRDQVTAEEPATGAVPGTPPALEGTASTHGTGALLPVHNAQASHEAATVLAVSRAALAEQYAAVRLLTARSVGADTALVAATQPATEQPAALPESQPAAPPRERPHRRRTLVVVAVAVALTAVATSAAVVTTLNMRDTKHPPNHQAHQPLPATATPNASPPSPSQPASRSPSSSSSASATSSPRARNTASTTSVPDTFIGTWEGESNEPGEGAATLHRFVIRKGPVGTQIADILTSSTNALCQSKGTLITTGTHLILAPEPVTTIPDNLCATTGHLTLRHRGKTTLTLETAGTTFKLHRATPTTQTIPTPYLGTWQAQDGNDPTSSVRLTIRQGTPGHARAEFAWDGDVHHCRGFSVLASVDSTLRFGPETVTSSEPDGFCTQTPTRVMHRPQGNTMHVQWIASTNGAAPRSFTFTRTN
ncbi:hypothetical protein [Streptomyces cucumeris]|uniref:hypothetical protein n=1 Tax=Streptomyces cucumeris TaxID=2962890 RepID=UPI0020C874C3|nr:hypothetical protein [Streptomyces sp. NEAU-Y11]MCP9211528.1 hypothetical protein [Streptomyces sp. NEAU-Y11]